jgi:hypothetical protein
MRIHLARTLAVAASLVALPALAASSPIAASRPVALAQDPVVMRLSKDEFRIAFGLNAEHCSSNGCSGIIRYRVDWRAEDGTTRSEIKRVSYIAAASSHRAMTVDRQYFDTSEGAHTTDIVRVSVESISCVAGGEPGTARTASTGLIAR